MKGLLSIALGALVIGVAGAYVFDWHHHQCDRCGHSWGHMGAFNAGNTPAHTCVRCGTRQWWKAGTPAAIRAAHGPVCEAA